MSGASAEYDEAAAWAWPCSAALACSGGIVACKMPPFMSASMVNMLQLLLLLLLCQLLRDPLGSVDTFVEDTLQLP